MYDVYDVPDDKQLPLDHCLFFRGISNIDSLLLHLLGLDYPPGLHSLASSVVLYQVICRRYLGVQLRSC